MRSRNASRILLTFALALAMAVPLLTASKTVSAVAPAVPTNCPPNIGTGKVSLVTPSDGGCVAPTSNDNSVESWNVQPGKTYTITLSGVTECSGDSIGVIVLSGATGNTCLTAAATGNPNEYSFSFTVPTNACFTYPIKYCNTPGDTCAPSQGSFFARRSDGVCKESHLRAATFDGECGFVAEISDCSTTPPQGAIQACKFFDNNANGSQDPGEVTLDGWPMTISPLDGGIPQVATQLTSGGCVIWTNLDPNLSPYLVTEGTPNETNWTASTATSQNVTVVADQTATVKFGNYCKQPSGGLTLGFWSNRNGQALITSADLSALSALCLRNADGSDFNPTTAAQVKSFLLGATATNMANMLSAQLAAMVLNVRHSFVNGNAFDLCSSKTINDLITYANGLLCANGNTTAKGPDRTAQEAAKNCLDALNNGGLVIPTTPCSYTFPTQ